VSEKLSLVQEQPPRTVIREASGGSQTTYLVGHKVAESVEYKNAQQFGSKIVAPLFVSDLILSMRVFV